MHSRMLNAEYAVEPCESLERQKQGPGDDSEASDVRAALASATERIV